MDLAGHASAEPLTDAARALEMLASPVLDDIFDRPQRLAVGSAWFGHVPFAHWLIAATRPRVLVELGTHNGVSYSAFCEAVARTNAATRCTAVDTWEGDEHAGHYGGEVFDDLRIFHDPRFGSFSTLMRCSFDTARNFFADGSIDLLHIDGLHTYEAVAHDWQNWRTALSDRAVVLFHDVNERQGSFGVWRLWDELCAEWPAFTFHHAHGLGVLAAGGAVPEPVLRLCDLESRPEAGGRVRERFAQLGERWDSHAEQSELLARLQHAEARLAGMTVELDRATGKAAELFSEIGRVRQDREEDAARLGAQRDAEIGRLGAELESAASAHAELQRSLAAARSAAALEMEQARAAIDRARLEAEAAHEQAAIADILRAERDSAWSHQGWLEAEMRRHDEERAALHAALAQRAQDWERAHGVLASQAAELEEARRLLHETRRSTSWRVTRPARAVAGVVPGVAGAARRGAALAGSLTSGEFVDRRRLRKARAAEIAALRHSPLFDAAFYLSAFPELAAAGHDPAGHYAWVGAWQGAWPNPYFDSAWYLARYEDASTSGRNPLLYWRETGAAAGHDPNPFLDTAWYCERHPEARPDPLRHYLDIGVPGELSPNEMLDAESYLAEHASARACGFGVLRHWWTVGAGAGLDPHPLFDAAWYRAQNGLAADADVLAHWLWTGRALGLPTSPLLADTGGAIIRPELPSAPDPEVTVIVPAYGHYFDTFRTLYALAARTGDEYRAAVLVIDDNPQCRIAPLLQRHVGGLHVVENLENLGFLRSCNAAARCAHGRALVFLNNDTSVHQGWLAPLIDTLDRHGDVGMVGGMLLNADGTVQEAGGAMPSNGWGVPIGAGGDASRPEYNYAREVDVVIGASFAVRRQAWDAAGGFDDAYAPAFYEEFDLAFAMRQHGWRVMYQPASRVTHLGSNSYGAETRDRQSAKNHALFCRKWRDALRAQPPATADILRLRQRPHDAKRLLFIDDRVPEWDRHAGALTNRQYIRLWQQLGYHVTFAPVADPQPLQPYTALLQQEGVEVLHAPVALQGWLARHGTLVDLVWTARPDVTGPLLATLRARTSAPILYYPHDLHHARERARWELEGDPHALAESERLHAVENRIFSAVDCVLCISETEAAGVRAGMATAAIQRVPAYIYPAPPPPPDTDDFAGCTDVLFVGGYAHPPNVDAARFLAREIMPLVWQEAPGIRLVLAGSAPPADIRDLAGPRTEVPGFVADLAPYYRRARISACPLRYGAGVKGKVVSALWEGLPVISTAHGADGLGLRHGVDAWLADTPDAFADAILTLWRDPALCAALARAGQDVVATSYTEQAANAALAQAIDIAQRRRSLTRRPAATEHEASAA